VNIYNSKCFTIRTIIVENVSDSQVASWNTYRNIGIGLPRASNNGVSALTSVLMDTITGSNPVLTTKSSLKY
jgi:hypothetical protein